MISFVLLLHKKKTFTLKKKANVMGKFSNAIFNSCFCAHVLKKLHFDSLYKIILA